MISRQFKHRRPLTNIKKHKNKKKKPITTVTDEFVEPVTTISTIISTTIIISAINPTSCTGKSLLAIFGSGYTNTTPLYAVFLNSSNVQVAIVDTTYTASYNVNTSCPDITSLYDTTGSVYLSMQEDGLGEITSSVPITYLPFTTVISTPEFP